MSNTDTRTGEQVVMGLAEGMKPCPGRYHHVCEDDPPGVWFCLDYDNNPLRDCGGTGQVAEFPMLRERCPVTHPTIVDGKVLKTHLGSCEQCQGRGWLPVVTTDALLDAGKPWQVGLRWSGTDWTAHYLAEYIEEARSDDKQMALALALEAAKHQE